MLILGGHAWQSRLLAISGTNHTLMAPATLSDAPETIPATSRGHSRKVRRPG